MPVLGENGPIAIPPAEKMELGSDGTISIRPVGQAATELAVIDRIKLVNPANAELEKGKDSLMRLAGGGEADAAAEVRMATGVLQSSNVNIVDSMVKMIELGRRFEMQVKMMQQIGETEESLASIMRTG